VSPILGSGNRDETKFTDPDRFDLRRKGPKHLGHLAFGEGPHRCLGEHLGGVEATVAMNRILDRLHDLRLEPGDRDPHIHGYAFRSPNCLPVSFKA
jgi:cytochrome P450